MTPIAVDARGRRAADRRAARADGDRSIAVLDFTNVTGDADVGVALRRHRRDRQRRSARALGRFRVDRPLARDGGGAADRRRAARRRRRARACASPSSAAFSATASASASPRASWTSSAARRVADAKVDGLLDEIFDLQDQVGGAVRARARRGRGDRRGAAAQPRDAPASRPTARSWKAGCGSRRSTCASCRSAIADFERAVAIDPRYALAWTGLATAEFASYESTRSENEPARDLLTRAIAHGRQAVRARRLAGRGARQPGADPGQRVGDRRKRSAPRAAPSRSSRPTGGTCSGSATRRGATSGCAPAPRRWRSIRISRSPTSSRRWSTSRAGISPTPSACSGTAPRSRIGRSARGERYPALGLHWLLGLVRLAQDDVEDALAEFDARAGAGRAAPALRPRVRDARRARPRRGAAARRPPRRRRRQLSRRADALSRSPARAISDWRCRR